MVGLRTVAKYHSAKVFASLYAIRVSRAAILGSRVLVRAIVLTGLSAYGEAVGLSVFIISNDMVQNLLNPIRGVLGLMRLCR